MITTISARAKLLSTARNLKSELGGRFQLLRLTRLGIGMSEYQLVALEHRCSALLHQHVALNRVSRQFAQTHVHPQDEICRSDGNGRCHRAPQRHWCSEQPVSCGPRTAVHLQPAHVHINVALHDLTALTSALTSHMTFALDNLTALTSALHPTTNAVCSSHGSPSNTLDRFCDPTHSSIFQ